MHKLANKIFNIVAPAAKLDEDFFLKDSNILGKFNSIGDFYCSKGYMYLEEVLSKLSIDSEELNSFEIIDSSGKKYTIQQALSLILKQARQVIKYAN